MTIERQSVWLRAVEAADYEDPFLSFALTIENLPVRRENISGNVLIGGQGVTFPERLLICTPESKFRKLRPEVDSVVCCDPYIMTDPGLRLDHRVEALFTGATPVIQKGSVLYYPSYLQEAIPFLPVESFNTVLFFRIDDIENQLFQGSLLPLVNQALKKGGRLIGSGSFYKNTDVKDLMGGLLTPEAIVQLLNPDCFGDTYVRHFGFICSKD